MLAVALLPSSLRAGDFGDQKGVDETNNTAVAAQEFVPVYLECHNLINTN